MKSLKILILIFAFCVLNLRSAQAQVSQSLTISPPTIKINTTPGEYSEGTLSLINNSTQDLTVKVSIYDFVVTDNLGTPQVLLPGTILNNKYAASSWLAVVPDVVTIKSHEKVTLNYYARIPGNATPGGHYAAIIYEPINKGKVIGSGASVNTQIATLVYFGVPGKIKENSAVKLFQAPNFQEYGPVNLSTEIENKGDLHVTPTGDIIVTDLLGRNIDKITLQERNIFPGVSLLYNTPTGGQIMIGRFKASLFAKYGTKNNLPLVATAYFWVFPWKVTTITILVIAAAVLGILYYKKRKSPTSPQEEKI